MDQLYEKYWQPLDQEWWRAEVQRGRLKRPRLDSFMNHWLSMRLGQDVVAHQLFPAFKRHVADQADHVEALLAELARYAEVYESFERRLDEDSRFGRFLYRVNVMEVTTSYPLLLWVFGPEGMPDPAERDRAMDAIESWLVRRVILKSNTQDYTAIFVALLKALRAADTPTASPIIEYLRGLDSERGYWPKDEQVREAFASAPLYNTITRARLRMILESIEERERSAFAEETKVSRDLTIEHVLPQEWRTHWPLPAAADQVAAEQQRDLLKQTIGNLTLVTNRLNPKMSNGPWKAKRDDLRRLSVLLISSDLRDAESWDESDITQRGQRLADAAMSIWPGPDDAARWGPLEKRPALTVDPVAAVPANRAEGSGRTIPFNTLAMIHARASEAGRSIAIGFAERLLAREELELRPQNSKLNPSYFQVRSPRFSQVLAYVHVFADSLRIDYRLPKDHDTGHRAIARDNFYGISYVASQDAELDFAMKLIDEALEQPVKFEAPA